MNTVMITTRIHMFSFILMNSGMMTIRMHVGIHLFMGKLYAIQGSSIDLKGTRHTETHCPPGA